MDGRPPAKRPKLSDDSVEQAALRARRSAFLNSLSRPVSPPLGQSSSRLFVESAEDSSIHNVRHVSSLHTTTSDKKKIAEHSSEVTVTSSVPEDHVKSDPVPSSKTVPSPIQLTKIRDLPASENRDTVSLHDILGDPLIKEAWIFNFCFDVDWLIQYFDPDVRHTVQVKIIHGSWRREDINKINIDDACGRRSNVRAIQAYLPDAFGTHHSKMFILFRHDDHAEVIIHTANMLEKDWTNMTQAVWRSGSLPLHDSNVAADRVNSGPGTRFKHDLLRYLSAYGNKLKPLSQQLRAYNFQSVKAMLVGSVPSKFKISASDDEVWGHEMLRRKVQNIKQGDSTTDTAHVVMQVSSIASLTTNWLEQSLYRACDTSKASTSIIFPTAPDVAESLDGYMAGGSIHTKAQTPAHLKQISMLRPQLCRWIAGPDTVHQAGRHLAAPHIKTYICFATQPTDSIPAPDIMWALITSANLSTQAWGSAPKLTKGEKNPQEAVVHIQSYEIGVLIYPALFEDDSGEHETSQVERKGRMIPSFKQDNPDLLGAGNESVIGFRMPYDLPLTRYNASELPWSPQSSYAAPDRHGVMWR